MLHNADETGTDRRAFLKAALYVAPVVMTLKAKTAYAQLGSSRPSTNNGGNGQNNQNNGQNGRGNGPNNQNNGQNGRGRGPAGSVSWKDVWDGNKGRGPR